MCYPKREHTIYSVLFLGNIFFCCDHFIQGSNTVGWCSTIPNLTNINKLMSIGLPFESSLKSCHYIFQILTFSFRLYLIIQLNFYLCTIYLKNQLIDNPSLKFVLCTKTRHTMYMFRHWVYSSVKMTPLIDKRVASLIFITFIYFLKQRRPYSFFNSSLVFSNNKLFGFTMKED